MKTWLITGGAGFIGSCFIRKVLAATDDDLQSVRIVNLDKLTYAGHPQNIPSPCPKRYELCQGDIADGSLVKTLLENHQPSAVIHFAAESHVDRSIDGPLAFVQTNVVGTAELLNQTLTFYRSLGGRDQSRFRFVHISTDEVYGSLGSAGAFTEQSPYLPNSPYAASKASSDLFVRAFHHTYGLPTLVANCSNNYGPFQFPEKLIPLMILNAVHRRPLPVYGDGSQVRDWLHVSDHCDAILQVLRYGRIGQTYNIGGNSERTNLQVVEAITSIVDQRLRRSGSDASKHLIQFVQDRPGHDQRYAVDAGKIRSELNWHPKISFQQGIRDTVDWYLNHPEWVDVVSSARHDSARHDSARPGLG
jgi:dTDP-glucose 4,6-dehydratase